MRVLSEVAEDVASVDAAVQLASEEGAEDELVGLLAQGCCGVRVYFGIQTRRTPIIWFTLSPWSIRYCNASSSRLPVLFLSSTMRLKTMYNLPPAIYRLIIAGDANQGKIMVLGWEECSIVSKSESVLLSSTGSSAISFAPTVRIVSWYTVL